MGDGTALSPLSPSIFLRVLRVFAVNLWIPEKRLLTSAALLLDRFHDRAPVPGPDAFGVLEEVLPLLRPIGEVSPCRGRTLLSVTGTAGGDKVSLGAIASAHLWLNVIQG